LLCAVLDLLLGRKPWPGFQSMDLIQHPIPINCNRFN